MNSVWVWVPSKGWKLVRSFRQLLAAIDCAEELEPLEVKVTTKTGQAYYGGKVVMVDATLIPAARTLQEALANETVGV